MCKLNSGNCKPKETTAAIKTLNIVLDLSDRITYSKVAETLNSKVADKLKRVFTCVR